MLQKVRIYDKNIIDKYMYIIVRGLRMFKRKVFFFKFDFRRSDIKTNKSGEEVVQHSFLGSDELKPYVDRMIDEYFIEIADGKYAKAIEFHSDRNVIETVNYRKEDSYIIFKIGHEKATNTVGIRDNDTLELTDVPLKENQNLEMFTYCLFDLKKSVCAIVQVYGAPTVAVLRNTFKNFFDEYYKELKMFITVGSILTDNILDVVTGKDIISNVTATVEIPQHKILDEIVYIDRDKFGDLQNMKSTQLTFSLVGKRNANMFKKPNQLRLIIEKLSEKYGDGFKKLSVRARNQGEEMQDYNMLEYCLTKSVSLSGEDTDSFDEKRIVKALKGVYTTSIAEIENYIR